MRHDIVYLAGIIDGEGCFSAIVSANGRGEKHRYAEIKVAQKDRRLLDWIKVNFGGNVSSLGKKYNTFQWGLRGKKAIALAKLVQPYLIVKDKQVLRCINAVCEFCLK